MNTQPREATPKERLENVKRWRIEHGLVRGQRQRKQTRNFNPVWPGKEGK